METPLLSGESSGSHSGRPDDPHLKFKRRSDAITYGSSYQRAAALVDLAEDGVGIPEQILEHSSFHNAAKFYFIFIRLDFIWTLNYFALISLNFFEKPLWCSKYTTYTCSDRDYFYLGELPYLTSVESLTYEGVTLILLLIHTFFPITYEGFDLFWKNHLNKLKVACLLILVADLLVYTIYLSPVAFDYLPLRLAPYIRVVFFVMNIRDLRDSIVILAGMLGTYLNVLALGILFLVFCSWVAYVMFEDTQEGTAVFTSFGTTLYQMFVLFTTSNNPDVWIPAYKASRWYCLFFVLYVLLGVYFVTNLVLAVVYDSFKSQLVKQVSEKDHKRISTLKKAFSLIDSNNDGFIDKEQCIQLFEELNKYRSLPKISRDDFELIFDELDDSRDFKINVDEFTDLCNAIALKFQKEDTPSWLEQYPYFYRSSASEMLKTFVRSPKFGYLISFILVLNLVAVIIETTLLIETIEKIRIMRTKIFIGGVNLQNQIRRRLLWQNDLLDIENSSGQTIWQEVEFVFGWIYVAEMALKVYSYGFENYWRDGQNRFDFVVTWVIVIGETITFVSPNGLTFLSNGEWIRYLLLARMLRLIRLLMYVQRYRAFIATFLTLIPSLMPYLGTIFCVLSIYCSLGLQIFGGLVNEGNSTLDDTDLADNDYLLFNFNDFPNGMVTLFNLLVMGNWQVWMQSYRDLTGTAWSLVYFVSFYLITVLLLLNLVVAFVLEAFFAELEMESSENCQDEDKEGESQKERRRSVGTKTRSQRVEMLLHHMLSAELNQKQCSDS